MPVITHSELEIFIKTYLNKFSQLTSNLSWDQKVLLLPRYLAEKCEITATISRSKGVSIRFNVTKNKESFKFKDTEKSIEDEVLPSLSASGNVFLVLDGENQVLENINLITKEFYDKNKDLIEKLTRSSNFIMDGAKKFVEIVSGDLKLVDCTLAFCKNGKDILDKLDCLWLFSSNQSQGFPKEKAELLAAMEYQKLASILAHRIPIQTLIGTLTRYKEIINNKKTTESAMQTFFENNWILLEMDARRVFPKFNLGGELIPDFVIETSDFRYIIVEIESPNVELYTQEKPPNPSRSLREADSQIKSYLSYVHENILHLRRKLPFLSGEKIKGLIVIGRSSILSDDQKKRLEQDRAYSKDYDIVTYDELFEKVRVFLENLGFRYSQI
jgi:hypothetical protein